MPPDILLKPSSPSFQLIFPFLLPYIALGSTTMDRQLISLEGEGRRKFGNTYILLPLSTPQKSHGIHRCFSYTSHDVQTQLYSAKMVD